MDLKLVIPLSLSHLVWFEKFLVELLHRPDFSVFSKLEKDGFGRRMDLAPPEFISEDFFLVGLLNVLCGHGWKKGD